MLGCVLRLALLACPLHHYAEGAKLEVGNVMIQGSANACFQSYHFAEEFAEVPVVVAMATEDGSNPGKIRLKGITNASFQACLTEPRPEDGMHSAMGMRFLAASPGVHKLPDGRIFEAGFVETLQRQAAKCRPLDFPKLGWEELRFIHNFGSSPALLTDLQTANNVESNQPSVPWLVVAVSSLTSSSARLALDAVKSFDGQVHVAETVGYIAFDAETSAGQITAPARKECQVGQPLIMRSWKGGHIRDSDGVLELGVGTQIGDWVQWTTALSNGNVVFTSHRSVQLIEDASNNLVLDASQYEWELIQADGGQVSLRSGTKRHLTDDNGVLQLVREDGGDEGWERSQKWTLLDASTFEICQYVVASPSTASRQIPYAVVNSDKVKNMGWTDGGQHFPFGLELSSSDISSFWNRPPVVGSLTTRAGTDGGWLRHDTDKLNSTGAHFRLDETENAAPRHNKHVIACGFLQMGGPGLLCVTCA